MTAALEKAARAITGRLYPGNEQLVARLAVEAWAASASDSAGLAGTKKLDDLRLTLGNVSVPAMNGDNLAIVLCGVFDNPWQDADDETGWTPAAEAGYAATCDAIHAHYAPTIAALSAQVAKLESEKECAIENAQHCEADAAQWRERAEKLEEIVYQYVDPCDVKLQHQEMVDQVIVKLNGTPAKDKPRG